MSSRSSANPIDKLYNSLKQEIVIKLKRNREFRGILKSFDNHLNVLLEDCVYKYSEKAEDETFLEKTENLKEAVIRGDNIVFIGRVAKD